jgi:uncharacterized protein with von Willebrand factor type A (vWA) domain
VPDVAGIRDEVREDLVRFVRALREGGVSVPADGSITATRALVAVGFDDEDRARAALRAALVTRASDIDPFDRMFAEFWRRLQTRLSDPEEASGLTADEEARPEGMLAALGRDPGRETVEQDGAAVERSGSEQRSSVAPHDAGDGEDVASATYSPGGQPEAVTVTVAARGDRDLRSSVAELTRALATQRGRRWGPAVSGERPDVRRSLRRSVSAGGAIVSLPEQARAETGARVVALVDVSRSVLDTIDRGFLVRWLRALRREARTARLFLFDTDVAEVTEAFDTPTAQAAVDALAEAETAWGAGTRIGHAVTTIREEFPDAVDRRTAVLVVSDGLEMGDVSELESGMVWLAGRARTVLWLNPLAGSPTYEPVAAGMAAALPAVDGLFAFAGPADTAEITRQLTRHGCSGPIGYRHDPRRVRESQRL